MPARDPLLFNTEVFLRRLLAEAEDKGVRIQFQAKDLNHARFDLYPDPEIEDAGVRMNEPLVRSSDRCAGEERKSDTGRRESSLLSWGYERSVVRREFSVPELSGRSDSEH